MIFSSKFFLAAAVLGLALVGISVDPGLLSYLLDSGYWKFFVLHFWTVSLSLVVGIALGVGLAQSRKGRNRSGPDSGSDPNRSHPFNK